MMHSPQNVKFSEILARHLGRHVKWLIFLSEFNQTKLSSQILINLPTTKFHGNPSSESQAVSCKQMG